jgi:phosphopantetheinyl transferase
MMKPSVRKTIVLVIEHQSELNDDELATLADWSCDDIDRIGRFRHQASKTSWCVARRLFDDALLELEGVAHAHRLLTPGEFGKPFLPGRSLSFNWSHADSCVALGFAYGREIGVDIELVQRPRGDYLGIAQEYFKAEERAWIESTDEDESWKRFLSLFVQKEAWLKSMGMGLSLPLSEAPTALALPGARSPGRALLEVGRNGRLFLAVDVSRGDGEAPDIMIESSVFESS